MQTEIASRRMGTGHNAARLQTKLQITWNDFAYEKKMTCRFIAKSHGNFSISKYFAVGQIKPIFVQKNLCN